MTDPLIPPPISPGDIIGIIAPSGQIQDRLRFDSGVRVLRELGFVVRFPPTLWPGSGYFADTDRKRADEFNRTWADPEVKALMAARGGFGCLRMLDDIDLMQIRRNPKLLVGFSDITILHSYLQQETGLVSLHGPVLTSLASSGRVAVERFFYSLTGDWAKAIKWKNIEILRGGKQSKGILTGGNLSSIISLLGTPFQPRWREKIVFLEDTAEPLYRIDRMLTQLYYAGMLKDIKGLILGDFSLGKDRDHLINLRHHEAIWQRALELTAQIDIPVWGGFPVGHSPDNLCLPMGAPAIMDSDMTTLRFS
jgi:muramoyltetrapeptide carboxypeptidase